MKSALFRVKSSHIEEDCAACVTELLVSGAVRVRNQLWQPRGDPALITLCFVTVRLLEHPAASWETLMEQGAAQTQLPAPCSGRVMPA